MSSPSTLSGGDRRAGLAQTASAIVGCRAAAAPSRELDARIAVVMFPALAALSPVEPGVWQDEDGGRVRALRYTGVWSAAATLVPAGCWIEKGGPAVTVAGAAGEWTGSHPIEPIALCIAALRARLAGPP
nr:hypothetical protein [Sphingomonas sp. Y57]